MIKEGVIRSPKWLRNFIDFEINTGEDIKGEKSKRRISKEKKEAEINRLKEWDRKWSEADDDDFVDFLRSEYPEYLNKFSLYKSDLEEFKEKHRGDDSVWVKFDKWKIKSNEQKFLLNEVRKLLEELNVDWMRNGFNYKDRIDQSYAGDEMICKYTFTKRPRGSGLGKLVTMRFQKDNTGSYTGNSKMHIKFEAYWDMIDKTKGVYHSTVEEVSITGMLVSEFIKFINRVLKDGKERSKSSSSSYSGKSKFDYGDYDDIFGKNKEKKKSDDPKRNLYDTLINTKKLREDQLKKMSKSDPDRQSLENELNTLNAKIKSMKDKYKFEHLCYFDEYNESMGTGPHDMIKSKFGISTDMIKYIIMDVTDAFPDVYWHCGGSDESQLIKPSENAFIIYFESEGTSIFDKKTLYDFERYLQSSIEEIGNRLSEYGLTIYTTDFGLTDSEYEIVICKKDKIDTIEDSIHAIGRYINE